MGRRLKALGVAALGARNGVRFIRRGRVVFNGLGRWLARFASLFYDVRHSRSGRVFFQIRDHRAEQRAVKKVIKRFRHSGR